MAGADKLMSVALRMSAFGTKRTSRDAGLLVRFRCEADIRPWRGEPLGPGVAKAGAPIDSPVKNSLLKQSSCLPCVVPTARRSDIRSRGDICGMDSRVGCGAANTCKKS